MEPVNLIPESPFDALSSLQAAVPTRAQDPAGRIQAAGGDSPEQKRRVQLAKDFESILTTRMVEEMKNTVGQWDEDGEEEGAAQQVQGIFWMHLAQYVGQNGGIGLWQQIVQVMNQSDPNTGIDSSTDDRL